MWEELLGNLEDHVALVRGDGRAELSVQLAAATSLSRDRLHLPRSPRQERQWQEQLATLRTKLADADFDAAFSEGCGWQIDQAIRAVLSTEQEQVAA
jgi:hypothetical protein